MKVLNYRKLDKGALKASVDIFFPTLGMEIYGITLFTARGKSWFSFPSRPYEDGEGKTKYIPYMRIKDAEILKRFESALDAAIAEYMQQNEEDVSLDQPPF